MTLVRSFLTVGGFTMVSRMLGFVRDILIAAIVGAGLVGDAFFVAFKLPNFFRRLFAEGAFNAGFVPLFTAKLESQGKPSAKLFAEEVLSVLLLALLVFVTLFQIFMPWAMLGLAPGFRSDPAKFELAVSLTRITFPYLLFISLVSLLGGVMNAVARFAAVAAAPILLNICLILALTVGSRFTDGTGLALAWGVAAAGALQLIWLSLACWRAGYPLRLRWPRLSRNVKTLLKLILPAAIGAGVVQVNLVIDLILATTLPEGSVSYLFFADRLNQLPIGVVGVAVGTAVLPLLSRQLARGQDGAAIATLNRAIELALLLSVPAAAAYIVLSGELIATLFQRGAFQAMQTSATATALVAYAVGLPAYVLIKVLGPAYFARMDTRTPVIIGSATMVVNVILNLILMQFLLHVGLALATALSAWLNIALMAWILNRRGHLRIDRRLGRRIPVIALNALVMATVVWFAAQGLGEQFAGGEWSRFFALAAVVGLGLVTYAGLTLLTGTAKLGDLRRLFGSADG